MIDGEKIRSLRNALDKTTAEVAYSVGVSESMMRQIELEIKRPSVENLKRIADLLGVTVDDLYKETA